MLFLSHSLLLRISSTLPLSRTSSSSSSPSSCSFSSQGSRRMLGNPQGWSPVNYFGRRGNFGKLRRLCYFPCTQSGVGARLWSVNSECVDCCGFSVLFIFIFLFFLKPDDNVLVDNLFIGMISIDGLYIYYTLCIYSSFISRKHNRCGCLGYTTGKLWVTQHGNKLSYENLNQ